MTGGASIDAQLADHEARLKKLEGATTTPPPVQPPVTPPPTTAGQLVVAKNIINRDGARFFVNGVCEYAITPVMTDGTNATNLFNSRDARFQQEKGQGINSIRVPIGPNSDNVTWLNNLKAIVASAKAQGMYTMLTGFPASGTPPASADYLGRLAGTFKDEPYVILEPWNEPNGIADSDLKSRMQPLIQAILNAGFKGLIVVDTNGWSWQAPATVGQWAVGMAPTQIVMASHRYANGNTFANAKGALDNDVTNPSKTYPVLGTEYGNWNGGSTSVNNDWSSKIPAYTRTTMHDAGYNGTWWFAYTWWDPNTMTGHNDGVNGSPNLGDWSTLNQWGKWALGL